MHAVLRMSVLAALSALLCTTCSSRRVLDVPLVDPGLLGAWEQGHIENGEFVPAQEDTHTVVIAEADFTINGATILPAGGKLKTAQGSILVEFRGVEHAVYDYLVLGDLLYLLPFDRAVPGRALDPEADEVLVFRRRR